jgi:hypothetical protein
MPFQKETEHPYDQLKTVGIAIHWNPAYDQMHVGVLHRLEDDLKLCHLKFHHDLARETPPAGYFWADCEMFSGSEGRVSNGRYFAGIVAETARDPNIPFGYAFNEDCFLNDGTYQPMEIGKGLTCATFIIALFHSVGYPIVKLDTWKPRADDTAWQNKILAVLRGRASPEHADAAAAFLGQFRYRPEEVSAAAVHPSPPLDFDESVALAAEILKTVGAAA